MILNTMNEICAALYQRLREQAKLTQPGLQGLVAPGATGRALREGPRFGPDLGVGGQTRWRLDAEVD